jgi:hypothetical protein
MIPGLPGIGSLDEAQRNPGTEAQKDRKSPDYAALHPGYGAM